MECTCTENIALDSISSDFEIGIGVLEHFVMLIMDY